MYLVTGILLELCSATWMASAGLTVVNIRPNCSKVDELDEADMGAVSRNSLRISEDVQVIYDPSRRCSDECRLLSNMSEAFPKITNAGHEFLSGPITGLEKVLRILGIRMCSSTLRGGRK